MSAPAKLPLLARKNIRDEFENKKEDLAKKYKDVFGQDYSFSVDFPTLFAQGEPGYQQDSIGSMAYDALDNCVYVIGNATKDLYTGNEDKVLINGFNDAVSKHTIAVVADAGIKSYTACRVNDGVFEIVFKPHGLGTNSYNACDTWKKAIDEASLKSSPKGLPPLARHGIAKEFTAKIKELEAKIAKELEGTAFTCNVDFEDMWTKIVDAREGLRGDDKDKIDLSHLAVQIGDFTYQYFESLLGKMKSELKGDDLMIEGFLDEVSAKEAWFGLIPETASLKGYYIDTTIEDGKLWSRTKPTKFGVNVHQGFEGFEKLL